MGNSYPTKRLKNIIICGEVAVGNILFGEKIAHSGKLD